MILLTTPDNLTHGPIALNPDDSPDLASYSSSPNTQAALQAAYAAGNWEHYTPPEPEPEQPEPNWSEFRLELMVSPSFRTWALTIPADWREDLKMAALAANLEALQSVYSHLASLYPPEPAAADAWQQIANDAHIPVVFQWPRP